MKSILYLSRTADKASKGIINKVNFTVKALKEEGYNARAEIIHKHGIKGSLKVVKKLLQSKEDLVLIRSSHYTMLIMLFPMMYARMKGQKIIIDVATPVGIAAHEVEGTNSNFFIKKLRKLLLYITFPLSFYPANRILEYSYESDWFSFGVKKKIKLVGNGIHVESVTYRKSKPIFNKKELNLIGVAHLAYWHGYDRLINSIYAYNMKNTRNDNKVRFNFFIVGEGVEKVKLQKLVKALKLDDQIHFLGFQEGRNLDTFFDNSHIGICSLMLFRKNLFFASELKARDYAARSMPFILACEDFDFQGNIPFIERCKNDDSLIDLNEIIKWYAKLDSKYSDFSFIRDFAFENLDYRAKVRKDILSIFD